MGRRKPKHWEAPKSTKRRYDKSMGKRLRNAALLFLATGFCISGSLIWLVIAQNRGANDWGPTFAIVVCFFAVLAAAVNMFRVVLFYRCPQCRAWLSRAPGQDGDPVFYVCARCKVEWDTGWEVSTSPD
jgi:hypothetical protein